MVVDDLTTRRGRFNHKIEGWIAEIVEMEMVVLVLNKRKLLLFPYLI